MLPYTESGPCQVHAACGPGERRSDFCESRSSSRVNVAGGSTTTMFQVAPICSADFDPPCDQSYPYRTMTGECNNLE